MAGSQYPVALGQTLGHQVLILGNPLSLKFIDNGLICGISKISKPRLPQDVHFTIGYYSGYNRLINVDINLTKIKQEINTSVRYLMDYEVTD